MYYNGIILEIKENYCLAMDDMGAVHRIKRKPNLKVGDKIYFLDEDIVLEDEIDKNVHGTIINAANKSSKARKIGALVAAIVIFIGAMGMVKYDNIAYATLSMDAEQSIQLELNRNGEVVGISSFGRKLSKDEMKRYKGLTMEEFWQLFSSENKDSKNPFMIGYVAIRGGKETESQMAKDINQYMVGKNVMVLKGGQNDIYKASEKNMSIGEYIFSTYEDDDELEDFLENSSKASVKNYLAEHQKQISKDDAKKIITMKNKIDRENQDDDDDFQQPPKKSNKNKKNKIKTNKPSQNQYKDDSDDDDDDDELDDDDDDDSDD